MIEIDQECLGTARIVEAEIQRAHIPDEYEIQFGKTQEIGSTSNPRLSIEYGRNSIRKTISNRFKGIGGRRLFMTDRGLDRVACPAISRDMGEKLISMGAWSSREDDSGGGMEVQGRVRAKKVVYTKWLECMDEEERRAQ
ncbi:hypothetical protein H5410_022309 [Solanum commersonii]|uniref:Uncharacterized protein n=1 Tax=Solanum commersonii TaxID=4109 RepID=A0A9J5ZHN6_SOLCO|nr:hypothetical protein H5410_022309 [Solanum commersonii]